MKRIIVVVLASLVLMSCNRREPVQAEIQLVDTVKNAFNERDYTKLKPFLSNSFSFKGHETTGSFTSLYAYINYKKSVEIADIEVDHVKESKDSVVSVTGEIFFKNYDSEDFEIQYKATKDGPKIIVMNSPWPHKFPLITRASFKKEEIAGGNPVENIVNLDVWDLSTADSLSQKGYTVYYDGNLKNESQQSLAYFHKLDSLLSNRFLMKEIEQENLYLSDRRSTNSIFIGTNSRIPWTMGLYESDSVNQAKLKEKIGSVLSHEIIEGTLVNKYNLGGYKYRWFRDGLSEYIAYEYCKLIDPKIAEKNFTEFRLQAAEKHRKDGNLLDWRANGPIKDIDKGKLYGSKFIYYDEVGQYGRAFKFFRDQFANDEEKLLLVLQEIKKHDNISVIAVLDIMSEVTGKNMREVISQY